jgi:hypothetical protein
MIDDAEAQPIFESFRDGSVLDHVGGDLTPENVSLEVRNGAGVPGMARTVADMLTERGFDVTGVDNHEAVDRTVVEYTEGNEDQARLVANQAPGRARLRQVDRGPGVALILGADAAEAARP